MIFASGNFAVDVKEIAIIFLKSETEVLIVLKNNREVNIEDNNATGLFKDIIGYMKLLEERK